MSDTQALYATAMLGKDAEEFLNSELCKMMLGMADQEASEAIEQLKRVAWWRKRRIIDLQTTIYRAESFKGYLTELVINGAQALAALEEAQEE